MAETIQEHKTEIKLNDAVIAAHKAAIKSMERAIRILTTENKARATQIREIDRANKTLRGLTQ